MSTLFVFMQKLVLHAAGRHFVVAGDGLNQERSVVFSHEPLLCSGYIKCLVREHRTVTPPTVRLKAATLRSPV